MSGLTLKCPECGQALKIRTSTRPTACTTCAIVFCLDCEIKAEVSAQVFNVKKADFTAYAADHRWRQDKK